jgi:TPR repeat protein
MIKLAKSTSLLLLFIIVFPAVARFSAADDRVLPSYGGVMSSNWMTDVRTTLPASAFKDSNIDFNRITNLLAAESLTGNMVARGLLGIAVLAYAKTPRDRDLAMRMLRESAEGGSVTAMLNLGYLLEGGGLVPRDYTEAFHWFKMAAEKGNADGQAQLGACYHYGFGTKPDLALTAKYYQLAADQTNYVAMKSLGFLLMNGIGVKKDIELATYWYKRAANEGQNRRSMYNLGVICQMKSADTNASLEAFDWFRKSAVLGDALGCQALAACYQYGRGTPTNFTESRRWLFQAATNGATEAEYRMGIACHKGEGVSKDEQAALFWYQKAAAKGHPDALFTLALHFLTNSVNDKTAKSGYDLLCRAARAGHREAQLQCALANFRGDITTQDCEAGKKWLELSARNKWPRAELYMFRVLYNGFSLGEKCSNFAVDKNEALEWLHRAADQHYFPAQSILGVMLMRGKDVPKDDVEGVNLLRYAADRGYPEAQNDLGYYYLGNDSSETNLIEAATLCKLAQISSKSPATIRVAGANLTNALARLSESQQDEVNRRVGSFIPVAFSEPDPKIEGWEENPDYQQENGRYGH